MAITLDEYRRLNRIAHARGIRFEVQPLTYGVMSPTLYQMTSEVCPFLDNKTNQCSIYRWRPTVCRMFPLHPYGIM